MKSDIIISIVTPSYNHAEFIEETLSSVISQAGGFFIDYIVVDGGSSDGTVDILKKYEGSIRKDAIKTEMRGLAFFRGGTGKHPIKSKGLSFRYLSEKDRGQADAINKGMRMAVGDILAFLNSDDTYYPGTLQKIASSRWRNADFLYGEGMWTSKEGAELITYPTFKPSRYNFVYQCTLCQPAVFMKRSTFETLGEFSQDFNVVFDFEYWMRAVFRGMKFRHTRSLLATSRFYTENKTIAQKETQINEVPILKKKYYSRPFSPYERWLVKRARNTVHKQTVEKVNRLHELIKSDIRYACK